MSALTWPTCTEPGCDHSRTHATVEDADEAARANRSTFVQQAGYACCICHGVDRAAENGVAAFECDHARATAGATP